MNEPHPRADGQAVDPESAPSQPEGEAPDSTVTPVFDAPSDGRTDVTAAWRGFVDSLQGRRLA